jgi:hypothetical protein
MGLLNLMAYFIHTPGGEGWVGVTRGYFSVETAQLLLKEQPEK